MPDFNPFDMDMDGDVDGIDFLGFRYLMRRVLQPDAKEQDGDAWSASRTDNEAHDKWDDDDETEDYY